MSEDRYLAAIEIGSSKIVCVVGRYRGDGQLDVVAMEQEQIVEIVRYGIIQNLEETATRVARIIEKIERKPVVAPRKITSLFVGLSGRSLRSIPTKVRLNLPEETEITDDILSRLREDALHSAIDNTLEVVDAVARHYRVGTLETNSPKGTIGSSIEADFDIIVCRPELKRNIIRTLHDKLGIEIAGFVVTPLAAAHLILSPEEKRLGCMMADVGAETTSVTIFRKGALNYFATLPLGGRNITRDLTSLSILEERAEDMKINSGYAIASEKTSNLNIDGVKYSDVANLIVARSEEIVANVAEQLHYAECEPSDLRGGVICIGGGAKLNGFTELITRLTGLNAKTGLLPSFVRLDDTKAHAANIAGVVSVLYAGATLTDEECLEIPRQEEIPAFGGTQDPDESEEDPDTSGKGNRKQESGAGRTTRKIRGFISRFFSDPKDDESDILE